MKPRGLSLPLLQDIVHLQEVWCRSDAEMIIAEAAKGRLKHGHHFVAGHFGSGLIILSRFPLKQVQTNRMLVSL